MDYDSDSDISWLTQTPSLENSQPNFDVGYSFVEEDIELDKNVISLEEHSNRSMVTEGRVLYDNVVVEDISSDENVDSL